MASIDDLERLRKDYAAVLINDEVRACPQIPTRRVHSVVFQVFGITEIHSKGTAGSCSGHSSSAARLSLIRRERTFC